MTREEIHHHATSEECGLTCDSCLEPIAKGAPIVETQWTDKRGFHVEYRHWRCWDYDQGHRQKETA